MQKDNVWAHTSVRLYVRNASSHGSAVAIWFVYFECFYCLRLGVGWCWESVRGRIYCISFWQRWNGLISVSSFPNSCLRTWDLQTERKRHKEENGMKCEIKKFKFTIREKLSYLFLYLPVHKSCRPSDILLFTFLIHLSGLIKNYFREIIL